MDDTRTTGFPDEKTLHDLVAAAPQLLPLSGSPRLIVLGREVLLGSGYADLLAVEPDGRPVIIETKLRNNTESRRAVVAQVLAYAAALHSISAEQFEQEVLAKHLGGRSLLDVIRESAQEESLDAREFAETLGTTLRDGTFRLVLVLDKAPDDLVRLVGYVEAVTSGLSVDLVTLAAYKIGDRHVIVPQRVEPERRQGREIEPAEASRAGRPRMGDIMPGVEPFRAQLTTVPNNCRRHSNGSPHGRRDSRTRDSQRCPHTSASAARCCCSPGCCPNAPGSFRCINGQTTRRFFRYGALCSNGEHPAASSASSRS